MIRVADDLNALVAFMDETRTDADFRIETIALPDAKHWSITEGMISHETGGFFHIVGLSDRATGREDLMIYQPQSALTGLIVHRAGGRIFVLVQARVEPGNSRLVNLGPTVQSTAGNYLRLHGGRPTHFLEPFLTYAAGTSPRFVSTQLDLGEFYYLKQKTLSVVETDTMVSTPPAFAWVGLDVLAAAARQDQIVNTDLRSMLATTPWEYWSDLGGAQSCETIGGTESIVPQVARATSPDRRMIPITALKNWEMDEFGVHPVDGAGRSVLFHDVISRGREVERWQQPLMHLNEPIAAVLLTRGEGDEREFLVTFDEEFGFPGRVLAMPSLSGSHSDIERPEGETLAECVQSEEGGRFYRVETRYSVMQVADAYPATPRQAWVSTGTLRQILQASNRASLTLRGVSATVMDLLNPHIRELG